MAGRGETMKMFVVQRTFRTVRKGYDPGEVDRHLELVSRWFTQTDAAKALREERERIEERERAAAEREASAERSLEGVRMEAEATIEAAHRRAEA
jgi:DivIVA domain-containing protein